MELTQSNQVAAYMCSVSIFGESLSKAVPKSATPLALDTRGMPRSITLQLAVCRDPAAPGARLAKNNVYKTGERSIEPRNPFTRRPA